MLRTTLPLIFGTRTHNIIYNAGKKKTVLLKIKNLHLNEKKKSIFTCCFWYAVFGLILDSKRREPRKKNFHLFTCILKFQSQHDFSDHSFLKQVITPFLPTISMLNPYSTALYFIFPLKDIIHIIQNIQECFKDWIFNLFLILSNDFSTEIFLEVIKSAKNQHTKSITTAFCRSPTAVLYEIC